MAAGAHAGDDGVQPLGEITQNFFGRGPHMDFDIGRVLELLWHPGTGVLFDQFLRPGDGTLHSLLARRQVERRSISQHQATPLDRHAVRHHQNQLVALDGRHHRQADASVAGGRLDDGGTRLQLPAGLGRFDHGQRDAVLDRAARVAALGLDPDLRVGTEQALHADMGRVANGGEYVVGFHGVGSLRGLSFWLSDNACCEASQTAAGASMETWHWRKVRTAESSVAANGCPA